MGMTKPDGEMPVKKCLWVFSKVLRAYSCKSFRDSLCLLHLVLKAQLLKLSRFIVISLGGELDLCG